MTSLSFASIGALTIAITALGCDSGRALDARSSSPQSTEPSVTEASSVGPLANGGELSFASFNVLYENAREDIASSVVDETTLAAVGDLASSDIIAFQETNPMFEKAIRERLATTHPSCAFHAPVKYLPGGMGLCVKAPLEIAKDEVIDSPVGWFPAQHVTIAGAGAPIEIFNVHLRPAVAPRDRWWEISRATRADRNTEMKAYLEHRDLKARTFVVGDFNDPNHEGVFDTLEPAGFVSAAGVAKVDEPTWRWAGEPKLEVMLDHITLDPDQWQVLGAEVRHVGRSDHYPLVIRLKAR